MRRLTLILTLLIVACLAPQVARADVNPRQPTSELAMDRLFEQLRASPNPHAAVPFEREILRRWHSSGDDTADLLLRRAAEAMEGKAYPLALDLLDRVIVLRPNFAEAWNKRATIRYLMSNYAASVADIERTLLLERRHFGALAGLGLVMRDLGEKEKALQAFERALAVHPHLQSADDAAEALRRDLSGDPI